jgi:hypothetical protein
MFLVSFCGLLFLLHLLQILILQFVCLSSLNLSHCERCIIYFFQVLFCRVLVISFVANVDELETYITANETTLCQAQECLGIVTFEKQEAFMVAMKTRSQMEDRNNHHHEKKQALQKMFVCSS